MTIETVPYRCTKIAHEIMKDQVVLEFCPPVGDGLPRVFVKLPGIAGNLFRIGELYDIRLHGEEFPRGGFAEWHIEPGLYDIKLERELAERVESVAIWPKGLGTEAV